MDGFLGCMGGLSVLTEGEDWSFAVVGSVTSASKDIIA